MVNTGMMRDTAAIWAVLREVADPEIPVVSICDLGIVREVKLDDGVEVVITPTYAGCPAMHVIEESVRDTLRAHGYADARVTTTLSPAWTTDWITEDGRRKLEEFGIAPPQPRSTDGVVSLTLGLRCPQCGSPDTRELSRFGSTACKSLWVCSSCREPFDHFKSL
jgi:ring-1,2-phenylacetyl-CoA epoxidase subunit PaaD